MKEVQKIVLTKKATQLDVVVLSVYLLGGEQKSIDTEDVATKCHELAPGMFSWRKYPDQINLELVRVVLSNAKKDENKALLIGTGREGWRMSAKGLERMQVYSERFLESNVQWGSNTRKAGSVDTRRKAREKNRLYASKAWNIWENGQPVSKHDALELFRIDEYSRGKMLEIKVVRLQSLLEGDVEVQRFLRNMGNMILNKRGNP